MKKLIYILIIASCFVSCKKDNDSTLSGEVIDQTTRNPISDVKVFLVGSTTSLGGNPGYTELENVTTGSEYKARNIIYKKIIIILGAANSHRI